MSTSLVDAHKLLTLPGVVRGTALELGLGRPEKPPWVGGSVILREGARRVASAPGRERSVESLCLRARGFGPELADTYPGTSAPSRSDSCRSVLGLLDVKHRLDSHPQLELAAADRR